MKIWTPRPDQQQVLDFGMPKDKWCLFAPPGAGKTSIGATWADRLMHEEMCMSRLLIVAPPMVARDTWPAVGEWQHLERFASCMRVLVAEDFGLTPKAMVIGDGDAWEALLCELDGATKYFCEVNRLGLTFRDQPATTRRLLGMRERVHVVSKGFLPWLVKAYGTKWPYDGIIYDESSGLRDQSSEQTKAMRKVVHSTKKKVAVNYLLELTGTPASNHGPAVFPQIDLIAHGLLAENLTAFRSRWCQPDTVNRQTGDVYSWKVVPALQVQLNARISTVAVSVPSTLATPLILTSVACKATPDALAAYSEMEQTSVWRTAVAANAGVKHSKLRQMAAGFCYDESGQVLFLDNSRIERIAEDANEYGGQIVVAFNFKEEFDRLKKAFGKDIKDIREKGAKDAFTLGRLRILAIHPASAGHGVDGLQGVCNQLWWASATDDAELTEQTNARVHRHGTNSPTVYVRTYYTPGTVEERIIEDVLPAKYAQAQALLQSTRVTSIVQPQ